MGSTPGLIHLCKWVWVRAYKRRDLYPRGPITGIEKALRNKMCTVAPRFNEPLCNVVLGITNDFLQPGQNYSKMLACESIRFSFALRRWGVERRRNGCFRRLVKCMQQNLDLTKLLWLRDMMS